MSDAMDKLKLIAEIRKRRELWDLHSKELRSCLSLAKVWKDVAASMDSDVGTCQRNWKSLCSVYRTTLKRVELRIKEAKVNGSYDPNNDYRSKWAYYEAMEFMKDMPKGSIKLRHAVDRLKFIAEVRKRSAIWDIQNKEHRDNITVQKIWNELALAMGEDVVDCKRKWYNLLRRYRKEVTDLELRIEKDKLKGSYNPKNEYKCKWIFFEDMQFCDDVKKRSYMKHGNTSVNDNNNSDDNDSNLVSNLNNMDYIKMDPELHLEPEVYLPDDDDDKPTTSNWKCTKRSYDQANVLKDLEKDDHKLIKSPRSDIKDSNDMIHVNDSDYNFLLSFLPQMEKINDLQNLQFRRQITNLVLNIMSPSLINDTVSVSSSHNVNSNN